VSTVTGSTLPTTTVAGTVTTRSYEMTDPSDGAPQRLDVFSGPCPVFEAVYSNNENGAPSAAPAYRWTIFVGAKQVFDPYTRVYATNAGLLPNYVQEAAPFVGTTEAGVVMTGFTYLDSASCATSSTPLTATYTDLLIPGGSEVQEDTAYDLVEGSCPVFKLVYNMIVPGAPGVTTVTVPAGTVFSFLDSKAHSGEAGLPISVTGFGTFPASTGEAGALHNDHLALVSVSCAS
jgi:hypothetical protein